MAIIYLILLLQTKKAWDYNDGCCRDQVQPIETLYESKTKELDERKNDLLKGRMFFKKLTKIYHTFYRVLNADKEIEKLDNSYAEYRQILTKYYYERKNKKKSSSPKKSKRR